MSVTVDWGDGTRSGASVEPAPAPRDFAIVARHTYARAGLYPIVIDQRNERTGVARHAPGRLDAHVSPTGLIVRRSPLRWRVGRRFSGVVASLKTGVPDAQPYAATIAWGDGRTSPGIVEIGTGTVTVSGTHTWHRTLRGRHVTVTFTASDSGAVLKLRMPVQLRKRT